jgi:hypothetical protein
MGKTLKYGEFTFSKPKTSPPAASSKSTKGISSSTYNKPHAMKEGGACYAKGGPKKPMKREPDAMVRREVAALKKDGAMDKKVGKVMGEFGRGELHSGAKDGPVVKNPKQAIAIAMSEGRKKMKKQEGGVITEGERARMMQKDPNVEKDRADSRVLQQLARKYGAQEEASERRGLMDSARAMGSRPTGAVITEGERRRMQQSDPSMTEGERARMMGRKNYAEGGSVESKLKKHASLPASAAHGPRAAKLAKGGVPAYSRVPKVC